MVISLIKARLAAWGPVLAVWLELARQAPVRQILVRVAERRPAPLCKEQRAPSPRALLVLLAQPQESRQEQARLQDRAQRAQARQAPLPDCQRRVFHQQERQERFEKEVREALVRLEAKRDLS